MRITLLLLVLGSVQAAPLYQMPSQELSTAVEQIGEGDLVYLDKRHGGHGEPQNPPAAVQNAPVEEDCEDASTSSNGSEYGAQTPQNGYGNQNNGNNEEEDC